MYYAIAEGWKRYELTNHLGNVLAVITDRKRGLAASGTDIQWYEADVMATQQYYPFGMRIYDPRVGRFLSLDPLEKNFPWWSPFQFSGNSPIRYIDLDGGEPYDKMKNDFWAFVKNAFTDYVFNGEEPVSGSSQQKEEDVQEKLDNINFANSSLSAIDNWSRSTQSYLEFTPGYSFIKDAYLGQISESSVTEAGFFFIPGGKIGRGLQNRFSLLKGTVGSYLNSVSGGSGLSFSAQTIRYIGTIRYLLLRPAKQLPASIGPVRLRHYTSESNFSSIAETLTLKPGRRGLVFNTLGGDDLQMAAKEVEMFLGLPPNRATHYIEYTIDASRIQMSFHPWTNALEYNVKGAIDLSKSNVKFFENGIQR